jgi:protease I
LEREEIRRSRPIRLDHACSTWAVLAVYFGRRPKDQPSRYCGWLAGAEYAEIPVDQAVTDGVLVTAPAWPAHAAWLAQFLTVLGTRISL